MPNYCLHRPVRVIGMSLDRGLWLRRKCARSSRYRGAGQKTATVLMGDPTTWRDVNGDQGGRIELPVAPTGPSFHSRRPIACLDRIIVHSDLRIDAAGVHTSAAAKRASDHLPVWARLSV